MMLPGIKAATMRRLLDSFVRGEKTLASQGDVREAKSALNMLDIAESSYSGTEKANLAMLDISDIKEELIDERDFSDDNQLLVDNDDDDDDVEEDMEEEEEIGYQLKDMEAAKPPQKRNPNRKPKPLKVKIAKVDSNTPKAPSANDEIACKLCNQSCSSYHAYICHLSTRHYQQELLQLYQKKDSCPICEKAIVSKVSSEARINKALHLGSAHSHVVNVAHKIVKEHLDDLRAFRQDYKLNTAAWLKCKEHFLQMKSLNEPCCYDHLAGPQEFRFHLAIKHYVIKLVSAFGNLGSPCQHCKIGSQFVADTNKDAVLHMIISHPQTFYALMPETAAISLKNCLKKDKNGKTSFATNAYKCPLCHLPHDKSYLLRIHLARSHFKQELLKEARIKEGARKCTLCGDSIGKAGMQKSMLVIYMAKHVGIKHKYLDKVLPDDIKQKLEDTEISCDKRIMQPISTEKLAVCNEGSNTMLHCPLCPSRFKVTTKADPLRKHLAICHFKNEVFSHAGVTDIMSCPLCEYKHVKSDSKSIGNDKNRMVKHVGLTHRYLDKVMPVELRMKLNEQLTSKMPRAALFEVSKLEEEEEIENELLNGTFNQ